MISCAFYQYACADVRYLEIKGHNMSATCGFYFKVVSYFINFREFLPLLSIIKIKYKVINRWVLLFFFFKKAQETELQTSGRNATEDLCVS